MRCPKCGYLSYDDVERCRNCGYDFALATSPREPDAPTVDDPTHEPRTWEPSRRRRPSALDTTPPAEGAALDLPLFEDPGLADLPPVVIPPAGPPLSVRRKVEIPRAQLRHGPAAIEPSAPGTPGTPAFDWPEETPSPDLDRRIEVDVPVTQTDGGAEEHPEGLGARIRAGLVDAALLVAIDVAVVWLTLRVAAVQPEEWRLLPLVPLVGFLFLLDAAYLVTFTAASGQTIGKMLSGVRVVYGDHGRVPFGHAVLRSVVVLLCAVPLG
ncbi:MAG TPA: RDD family protein, partial [Luteitalea sp.]|nr:RDD family protein [Luteitalea sp.]